MKDQDVGFIKENVHLGIEQESLQCVHCYIGYEFYGLNGNWHFGILGVRENS